jgi:transcriptional regulator with XRE-family HTH domain
MMTAMTPAPEPSEDDHAPALGLLLRRWRRDRGLSQLDLATDAQISARHLSYLETGRAQPSREMVQRLVDTLALARADAQALFVASGFAPPPSHGGANLTAADLAPIRQILDTMLRQQEPYPALVIDADWTVQARNRAAVRLLGPFRAAYTMDTTRAANAMHVVFHPGGLRPFIDDWPDFAGRMLHLLDQEVALGSMAAARLLADLQVYDGIASARAALAREATRVPVTTLRLRRHDVVLAFISTFTTFAGPADAALQRLKIECFFPADDATAIAARRAADEADQ